VEDKQVTNDCSYPTVKLPLWTPQDGFIYDREHPWVKALENYNASPTNINEVSPKEG